MKAMTSIVVLLFLPVVAFCGPTCKIKSPQVVDAYGRVMVGFGTGSPVGNNGHQTLVMTNHHVASTPGVYTVYCEGKEYKAKYLTSDKYKDLALLIVDANLEVFEIGKCEPGSGFQCEHRGFPGGGNEVTRQGRTVGYDGRRLNNDTLTNAIHLEHISKGGESGSGVYGVGSNVLFAVVSEAASSGDPYTLAVGTSDIRDFLRKNCSGFPKLAQSVKYDVKANQTYESGVAEATKSGLPLVTFVGLEATKVDGAITCHAEKLDGFNFGSVIVSVNVNGRHAGEVFQGDPNDPKEVLKFARLVKSKIN